MTNWDSFCYGLFDAFSWENDKINVLLGGPPQWTYVLGLVCNLALWLFFCYILLIRQIINIKQQKGSWREYGNFVKSNLKAMGRLRFYLVLLLVMPSYLLGLPYYMGYRITNGIWRYHYFTSQETTKELAAMGNFDLYVGGSKSNYASIEADLILANEPYQQIHVSNATKSFTRKLRRVTEELPLLPVYAWIREDKRVIYISFD